MAVRGGGIGHCGRFGARPTRGLRRPSLDARNGNDLSAQLKGEEWEEECARIMRGVECPPVQSLRKEERRGAEEVSIVVGERTLGIPVP